MDSIESELAKWSEKLLDYRIPRWEELPDIGLYMDQVVTQIEKYFAGICAGRNMIVTAAMVNNYVKLKLIPPPVKKKYSRAHLAYLIAITILKQVVTISEVKSGIMFLTKFHGAEKAFNLFCDEQEAALRAVLSQTGDRTIVHAFDEKIEVEKLALKMTALAFASKLLAEKTVQLQSAGLSAQVK